MRLPTRFLILCGALGGACGDNPEDPQLVLDAASPTASADASAAAPRTDGGAPAPDAPAPASDASGDSAAPPSGSTGDAATPSARDASSADDAGDAGPPVSDDAGKPDTAVIVAAPNGKDDAAGTLAAPTSLKAAIGRVAAGGSIELLGGSYAFSEQLTIAATQSGAAGKLKTLRARAGEKPVLDFSAQPYGGSSNPRGLQINASYWHVIGLTVKGSADNGIYVAGSNNVVERCVTHGNRDTGLQIGRASSSDATIASWPANNLILNCESYDNYDAPPGSGENADGFAAKLTVGPGNVFRGCVAHHNIDDGWDLYTKTDTGPIGSVTIDQCVAHHNGSLTSGMASSNGDRNGFKLGGEKIAVSHTVTRSVAFANGKNGFTWNSNPGAIRMFNNLAFDNAEGNFLFGSSSVTTQAVFANNVSFWSSTAADQSDKTMGMEVAGSNAFWDTGKSPPSVSAKGLSVTAADFASAPGVASVARH
ncbi:MAG TPA: right-handed parallel beta-helix repeat-containing protein, partial [Polyangiales bacterium]